MKKAWYIIANPVAGQGTIRSCLEHLCQVLTVEKIPFTVQKSERKGHAIALVEIAVRQGYRKIIALGGDGTNNEVVNGILQQQVVPSTDITYALLPCGTGNDWVKEYQIPKDVNTWVAMLKRGETLLQDIGKVAYQDGEQRRTRYFANVAGMSYDAFVIREMEQLKRPMTNRLGYLLYGLYYVFRYQVPRAKVWVDDEFFENDYYLINAGICRYSGGGMQLVPHALPADGKLAITLAGPLTKVGVLLNSYRFYNGKLIRHPKVTAAQAGCIRVEHERVPVLLEVDGEYLGTSPVVIRLLPQALRIVLP